MANAKLSTIATQCTANAAAIATAMGGGIVTSDVTALGAVLACYALSPDLTIPTIGQATTPALASTMIQPS
jgi:hypothetical protein